MSGKLPIRISEDVNKGIVNDQSDYTEPVECSNEFVTGTQKMPPPPLPSAASTHASDNKNTRNKKQPTVVQPMQELQKEHNLQNKKCCSAKLIQCQPGVICTEKPKLGTKTTRAPQPPVSKKTNSTCEPCETRLNIDEIHCESLLLRQVTSRELKLPSSLSTTFVQQNISKNEEFYEEYSSSDDSDRHRPVSRVGESENDSDFIEDKESPAFYNLQPLYCSIFSLCISLLLAPYSICCSLCGIVNSVFAYVEHRHGDLNHYRNFRYKSRCCYRLALLTTLLIPALTIVLVRLIHGQWIWEMFSISITLKQKSKSHALSKKD